MGRRSRDRDSPPKALATRGPAPAVRLHACASARRRCARRDCVCAGRVAPRKPAFYVQKSWTVPLLLV